MRTNNLAWIIAIVMAVIAVLSWVYNLNTNDGTSQVQTEVVKQSDTDLPGEVESLKSKIDDLTQAHRGLIEENTALRTLNENLKGELTGTSSEIAQLIQQLDQANIENDAAKAELESILAKVENGEMNTVVPVTVDTNSVPQSDESQHMTGQPESPASELEGAVQTLTAELEIAKARTLELQSDNSELNAKVQDLMSKLENAGAPTVEPEPDSSTSEATEQTLAIDSDVEKPQPSNLQSEISDLNAEVSYLTAELEIAKARTDKLQSDNSELDAKVQDLMSKLENTGAPTVEPEPDSSTSEATEQTLAIDSDVEKPQPSNLQSEISDLNAEVSYLTAELEIAKARSDKLQTDNFDLNAQVQDLVSNLETVSAQTVELQSENLELNRKVQTTMENSLAEKSMLEAELSNRQQAIENLSSENESLQNDNQKLTVALNQTNTELTDTQADAAYLGTRLRYASKHLRRIRKQIRTTESNTDALISHQRELAANLTDELQDKQTQMERLISDYSAITLESDVVYESGSARLNERGFEALANISEQLLKFPGRIVSVEGHTDSKQISARLAQYYPTNWELSAARAAAAANFLIDQGVPEGSVRVVGYGPLRPVASNDSDEGRAANRRIEIRLVPELAERAQN